MTNKFARFLFCAMLVVATLILASCGNEEKKTQRIKIVASFYPMYISALNVTDGVENVEVVNLTNGRAGCLHDYGLTTENMRLLSDADILIVNGGGMEEFLEQAKKECPKLKIIDATEGAEIDWIKDKHGVNSHVWMNIRYNIDEVNNIANGLAKLDAEHASVYRTNARLYEEKLLNLETEISAMVEDLGTRDIITFHDAFPYFVREFNLNIVASLEATPGHNPSPQEVAEIIEKIRPLQRKVIFTEAQYSPEAAEMIAYETGAQIFALDPVVTGESNKGAYIEAMRKNARILREALR